MCMYVFMHGNQLSGFQVGWCSLIADGKAAGIVFYYSKR